MERILESLAENVSEACYDEIIGIVEELTKDKVKPLWGTNLVDKTLRDKKYRHLSDSAIKTITNLGKSNSPSENQRLVASGEQAYKQLSGQGQRHQNQEFFYSQKDRILSLPKYQHFKKLAKKALKGHTLDGTTYGETYQHELPTVNPKKLYRIGQAVHKHQKKAKNESLEILEQILEDLRSSYRKHRENIRKLSSKVGNRQTQLLRDNPNEPYKYNKKYYAYDTEDEGVLYGDSMRAREEAENKHGKPAYKRTNKDTSKKEKRGNDYMDVIAKKAPGVSFTGSEWNDDYDYDDYN